MGYGLVKKCRFWGASEQNLSLRYRALCRAPKRQEPGYPPGVFMGAAYVIARNEQGYVDKYIKQKERKYKKSA